MKMTQENMGRFESMIKDFMDEHGLRARFEHAWDVEQTQVTVEEFETRARRNLCVDWKTKKSLSQAGAIIFAYITREFDLDGRNHFMQPVIKNVIFNKPATIVLWDDGTKTVVKCQEGEEWSAEHGLAMCIAKKAFGNKGNFNDIFKKWIPEEKLETMRAPVTVPMMTPEFAQLIEKQVDDMLRKFHNRPRGREEV